VLGLYIKFGSNICDSHWGQHTYALDVHLMTSRELTSGFDFWSRGYLRMAVVHLPIKFGADICIQSRVIDIFRNSRWRPPPSWIFSLCEFCHFGVFIVYGYLCSVPNLVQISVIVTEIDAHMLKTFSWWRHANWLPVLTFGHVVISAWPCIFPYNLFQDIFIQSKVIDIFPKFKMAADGETIPVSYFLTSLSSEGESLSANQMSSRYLHWRLRYNYLRFRNTDDRHIGILLPVSISTSSL